MLQLPARVSSVFAPLPRILDIVDVMQLRAGDLCRAAPTAHLRHGLFGCVGRHGHGAPLRPAGPVCTVACNPLWPEIKRELLPHQTVTDHPEIVCRIFHLKLQQIIHDITKLGVFGAVQVGNPCGRNPQTVTDVLSDV